MKRKICIFLIVSILASFPLLSIKPVIIFLIQEQLKRTFVGAEVAIGSCSLKPTHQVSLFDVKIKKGQVYGLEIKEMGIRYSMSSLLKGIILQCYIKDAVVCINLPQKDILELRSQLHFDSHSPPAFLVGSLELTHMILKIRSRDLSLEAAISSEIGLDDRLIHYVDLKMNHLEGGGVRLDDVYIQASQGLPLGLLHIGRVTYQKFRIGMVEAKTRLVGKDLFLVPLTAGLWGGNIQGEARLRLEKDGTYSVKLRCINLNLETFVNDFELKERIQMSGCLTGDVGLEGSGVNARFLNGDLASLEPGGVLTIKDNRFLENVARDSQQPLNILVESFREYHYNTGRVKVFLEQGSLILDTAMEGETGRRNLHIVLHDFRL